MHSFPRYPRHILTMWLHLAALSTASAQTDTVHGRITTPHDTPIVGAHVTVSAIPSGDVRRTRTNDDGLFTITIPGQPASYTVGVIALGFAPRRVELRRTGDSHDFPADVRMEPASATLPPVRARASRRRPPRDDSDGSSTDRHLDPTIVGADQLGDIAAMAASMLGANTITAPDGTPTGFSVLGLSAAQNLTTLDGLGIGFTELPSNAPVSMSMATSPFDVSRGGFNGAHVTLRSRRGTDYVTRVVNGSVENTRHTTGGLLSGPIAYGRAYYALSYQLGRRSSQLQSLLDTRSDSTARLMDILRRLAVPVSPAQPIHRTLADDGSVFGSFDVVGPTRTTGHAASLTYAGNWSRQTPAYLSPTELPTRGSQQSSRTGTVQIRHTGYLRHVVLAETIAGVGMAQSGATPFVELPTGHVLTDHRLLSFGGAMRSERQSSVQLSARNQLSWYSLNERHLISISTELRHERAGQTSGGNELGMFSFASLDALAAGAPSSFSRTTAAARNRQEQWLAAISIGDRYAPIDLLEVQYGVRLDANRFAIVPQDNAAVSDAFGLRTSATPSHIYVSPRVGVSWRHGSQRRSRLAGGIGIFQGLPTTTSIASALSHTGLPTAAQSIACSGASAPRPDWAAYATSTTQIPWACQDGSAEVVSSGAPNVVLFDRRFRSPRSLRSNIQWRTALRGLVTALEGTYSLNTSQPTAFDVNLGSTFDTLTARTRRRFDQFAHVTALRSEGRSVTRQLGIAVEPAATQRAVEWSVGYLRSQVRERRPDLDDRWAPAARDWRHQVQYALTVNPRDVVRITWYGSLRSGLPFTPMIAGDANGDGYANDRAFIFGRSDADTGIASAMRSLLDHASPSVRACLAAQENTVATRGSCRGPWTSASHVTARINPARLRLPRHAAISLAVSSPLGALDRWLHGESQRHGWDDVAMPVSTLLFLREFDVATQRYRYDVNPRFGTTDRAVASAWTAPRVTVQFAFDVGPGQERQMLARDLARGRRTSGVPATAESLRQALGAGLDLPNPMATLLRNAVPLALTPVQADSIAAMNGAYVTLLRTVWNPVWSALGELPREYDDSDAYARYRAAREATVDQLILLAPHVTALLTHDQRKRLTADARAGLDVGYLRSIRSGTMSQGVRGMVY